MRLIIAEKPSVAQSIASALGGTFQKHKGYLESQRDTVSWCFGHLAGLAEAKAYNVEYEKWELKDLPIVPSSFRFQVMENKREQFDILCELLRRDDVTEVVNACDAGREGELIFRTVYYLSGCSKSMTRLWISSMEDSAIREGFRNLTPGGDYDGLYQAALCRAEADWLVGINATRFFSLIYGRTLNIGRVMSPTLALIVQREAEISAFVSEPFYHIILDCGFSLTSERIPTKAAAEVIACECKGKSAAVVSVERKVKSEKPPALYDLTTLQREANRNCGFTAQQTLDYLQSLYEKRLCTYPRTDSRFLTDDMANGVSDYICAAASILGCETPSSFDAARICNSRKVSDHHAIIPTLSAKGTNLSVLPKGEQEILKLISTSLIRGVCQDHQYAETTVTAECNGNRFSAKGKETLVPGWILYDKREGADTQSIPPFTEGQSLPVSKVSVKEGQTAPPKFYTEDTLLSAMETAGNGEIPEDSERRGIGTPATRSVILEKLIMSNFVQRKVAKKVSQLRPTAMGSALITVLPEQLQSPTLTAQWEHRLKLVEHGDLDAGTFLNDISDMLESLFFSYTPCYGSDVLFPPEHEAIGKCPRCGAWVTERKNGFFCERKECSFVLWKNNRFFEAKRKTLNKAVATALLQNGQVLLKGCYSEKTGRTYDATVILADTGDKVEYKLVFPNG